MQQTFSLSMTSKRQVTYLKALVDFLGLTPGKKFQILLDKKKKTVKHQSIDDILDEVTGSLLKKGQKYIFQFTF